MYATRPRSCRKILHLVQGSLSTCSFEKLQAQRQQSHIIMAQEAELRVQVGLDRQLQQMRLGARPAQALGV